MVQSSSNGRVSKFKRHVDRVIQEIDKKAELEDNCLIDDDVDRLNGARFIENDNGNVTEETDLTLQDVKKILFTDLAAEPANYDGESYMGDALERRKSSFAVEPSREHVVHRNRFLSKLAYSGVWRNQPSGIKGTQKSISLTIFDWDDTLFPTSAFSPKTFEEMQ